MLNGCRSNSTDIEFYISTVFTTGMMGFKRNELNGVYSMLITYYIASIWQ